jgi:hypothetical protein
MNQKLHFEGLYEGLEVIVKHDQGLEIGTIYSINFVTGKVLIYFNYPECPHFASFNVNQILDFKPRIG